MNLKFKANRLKVGYFCVTDGTISLSIEFPIAEVGEITLAELERLCKTETTVTIEAADEQATTA